MLDAYWWKGDKLQVTNHSPDPSCYPKVIMAVGVTELVYLPKKVFVQERISSMIIILSQIQYPPGKAMVIIIIYF